MFFETLIQFPKDYRFVKMCRISIILIFTLLVQVIHCDVTTYTCEVIEIVSESDLKRLGDNKHLLNTNVCILKGLILPSSEKKFVPVTDYPTINKIDALWIENSEIKVLTDDICKVFPSIKVFGVRNVGLTSVDENAFQKCTKLTKVFLDQNTLTTLPSRIFYWNPELRVVDLHQNKLEEIDQNLFKYNKKLTNVDFHNNHLNFLPINTFKNNPSLTFLNVSNNQLSEILFLEEMPTLKNLKEIRLHYNNLPDVDLEKVHANFPNLQTLELYANEFYCDRHYSIKTFLNENKIQHTDIWRSKQCFICTREWKDKRTLRKCNLENFQKVKEKLMNEINHLKSKNTLLCITLGSVVATSIFFLGISCRGQILQANHSTNMNRNDSLDEEEDYEDTPRLLNLTLVIVHDSKKLFIDFCSILLAIMHKLLPILSLFSLIWNTTNSIKNVYETITKVFMKRKVK